MRCFLISIFPESKIMFLEMGSRWNWCIEKILLKNYPPATHPRVHVAQFALRLPFLLFRIFFKGDSHAWWMLQKSNRYRYMPLNWEVDVPKWTSNKLFYVKLLKWDGSSDSIFIPKLIDSSTHGQVHQSGVIPVSLLSQTDMGKACNWSVRKGE